jgi:hypothetical protein
MEPWHVAPLWVALGSQVCLDIGGPQATLCQELDKTQPTLTITSLWSLSHVPQNALETQEGSEQSTSAGAVAPGKWYTVPKYRHPRMGREKKTPLPFSPPLTVYWCHLHDTEDKEVNDNATRRSSNKNFNQNAVNRV